VAGQQQKESSGSIIFIIIVTCQCPGDVSNNSPLYLQLRPSLAEHMRMLQLNQLYFAAPGCAAAKSSSYAVMQSST
jgi:hypothetical protein